MSAPRIVLAMDPEKDPPALPGTYAQALAQCGAQPVPVCADGDWARQMDGLVLAGGGDVDPARYGQPPEGSTSVSPGRDALELSLFAAFYRAGKPILGICRGHQVVNVALGGTLIQDIKARLAIDHPYERTPCHGITVAAGSFLSPYLGTEHRVNSTHHQAVDRLAPGLIAVAWSEQGRIIEALEAPGRPLWCVQWHPERMMGDRAMAALMQAFAGLCGGKRGDARR